MKEGVCLEPQSSKNDYTLMSSQVSSVESTELDNLLNQACLPPVQRHQITEIPQPYILLSTAQENRDRTGISPHWDPYTGTPPHWDPYTGTPTLGPLHWDPYTGTPTLGPLHWDPYTGTPTPGPLHWDHYTGTPTPGPLHRDPYTGTPTLGPLHRDPYTGTPTLGPLHWDPYMCVTNPTGVWVSWYQDSDDTSHSHHFMS